MNLATIKLSKTTKLNLLLLALDIGLFWIYFPTDHSRGIPYNFHTIVDDYIPLLTGFIWIYLSYFVFLLITVFYFFHSAPAKETTRLLLGVTIACLIAYVIYFFFQNSVSQPVFEPQNISNRLYLWVIRNVPPFNAFPSLHVAISTIVGAGYLKIKSKFAKPAIIWAILIISSTLLAKQHYVLDVLAGFIVSWVSLNTADILIKKIK